MKSSIRIPLLLLGALALTFSSAFAALPGGKARFSIGEGNFDTSSATWVRIANWTFDDTAGTVTENYWQWDSVDEMTKVAFHTHTCTFDGVTKTCTTFSPAGWQGTGLVWTGNYTYNASTGALQITWPGGYWENWTVTNPTTGLAKVEFVSNNYGITHGRGYGSNASFSTFKTVAQLIPSGVGPLLTGYRAGASFDGSVITVTNWTTDGVSIDMRTGWTTPSAPSPANCIHAWLGQSATCGASCSGGGNPNQPGRIYHIISDNTSRKVVYNNFCGCLPFPSEWPCYTRGLHHLAFFQIIDDSGNFRGFIGVGAEDDVGTAGYAYQVMELKDF